MAPAGHGGLATLADYVNAQFDPAVRWSDIEWMIDQWSGPFAVKGLLHPVDIRQAAALGATAVVLSNHGGRQLDGTLAPLQVLPSLERRLLESVEIIVDGGVRRGTDVVKALALGARACMIGRPYLYGLAVAGEAGVGHVLRTLAVEVRRAMALLGATTLTALTPDHVRRLDAVNC